MTNASRRSTVRPGELHHSEFVMHLRELAARAPWIVAAAVVVGGVLLAWGLQAAPRYEATVTLRVSLAEGQIDDGALTEFATRSLAEMATTTGVVAATAEQIGEEDTVSDARGRIRVALRDTPGYLMITAQADTAQRAADWANTHADVLLASMPSEAEGVGLLASGAQATVVEPADAASAPRVNGFGQSFATALLGAVVAAIVVGEGLIGWRLLRGRFSPVNPAAEIAELVGASVHDLRLSPGRLLPFYTEQLERRPVLTVMQLDADAAPTAARQLAQLAGDIRSRVLAVDTDPAQPLVALTLDERARPSIGAVLSGRAPLRDALVPASSALPVPVVPAGMASVRTAMGSGDAASQMPVPAAQVVGDDERGPTDHTELHVLGGSTVGTMDRLRALLNRTGAEQLIVSSTGASSVDESLVVARSFPDAVVLAFDPERFGPRQLRRRLEDLHRVGATVVAVLLTDTAVT